MKPEKTEAPSDSVTSEERNALPKKAGSTAETKKRRKAFNRTKVVGKRFAKNRAERPFFAISAAVPLGGRGGVMPYKSFSSVKRKAKERHLRRRAPLWRLSFFTKHKKEVRSFRFSQAKAPSDSVPNEERNALPKKVSSTAETKKTP